MNLEQYSKVCSCLDYARSWYHNDLSKKKFWDEHRNTCDGCHYCNQRDFYGYHPNDGMSILDPQRQLHPFGIKELEKEDFLLLIKQEAYKEPSSFCPVCFGFPCVLKGRPSGPFIAGAHLPRLELNPDVYLMMCDIIGGFTKIISWCKK